MYFTEKEKDNMEVLFSEIANSKKNDFIFFYSKDLILSVKVENFFDSDNDENLDCDFSDHIIIRFHQHWKGERLYYDVKEFSTITEYTVGM